MKKQVITYNTIEGFHYYPDAPKFCQYLKNNHRHLFEIRCRFNVSHNNRDIEINDMQKDISERLHNRYGNPCEFKEMSCEDIAEFLLNQYQTIQSVQVLEDGYGGAEIAK